MPMPIPIPKLIPMPIRSSYSALLAAAAAVLAAGLVSSCGHTGSANTAAGAVIMTSLAGGVSAARRAGGDCYVDCLPGTRCNRQSGLCETLPCRDLCGPNETCDETITGIRCIPASQLSVQSPKGAQVTRTGAADAPEEKRADGKVSAPAAAVSGGTAPPAAKAPHEGESRSGPAQGNLPVTDPSTPQQSPQMENPYVPPPR